MESCSRMRITPSQGNNHHHCDTLLYTTLHCTLHFVGPFCQICCLFVVLNLIALCIGFGFGTFGPSNWHLDDDDDDDRMQIKNKEEKKNHPTNWLHKYKTKQNSHSFINVQIHTPLLLHLMKKQNQCWQKKMNKMLHYGGHTNKQSCFCTNGHLH